MGSALSTVLSDVGRLLRDLRDRDYVLSDTRVRWASLYDHLLLTCGIAVASVVEVLGERSPAEICGKDVSVGDLIGVVRVASLLHDWGKDYERAGLSWDRAYVNHTERSVEWLGAFLEERGVDPVFSELILGAVERHHLGDGPRTLLERIICLADSLASAGDRPELAKAETWDELKRVMHGTFQLYGSVFGGENGLVLILGDVDRVKSYVFETSKLPEIRGASELLKNMEDRVLGEIFREFLSEECLIYRGGGSFLAVAPRRLADTIIRRVEEAYVSETLLATITCVKSEPLGCFEFARGLKPYSNKDVVELSGDGVGEWLLKSHLGREKNEWPKRKGFGELVAQLASDLRLKKAEKEIIPFYPALPVGMRCTSCGKRMVKEILDSENRLCNVCEKKRREGVKERVGFMADFGEWLEGREGIRGVSGRLPTNLDELAKGYQDYMAFIYADGNDIGSMLSEARSPADYRRFSETLKNATRNALYEALYETIGAERLETLKPLPFEIVNVGGDDITLILAAPFAFDFARNFLRGFERMAGDLSERFDRRITMSLGMVICKAKFPVYFAERLASSLLSDAKRRAKEKVGSAESAFSYLYLTTQSGVEDSEEIINNTYSFEADKKKWTLTMRPYTLDELEKLLEYAERFRVEKLFSRTQLNALAEVLSKGRVRSTNYLLYQISRLSERKTGDAMRLLEEIDKTFNCRNGWRSDEEGDVTPLLDIIEILDIRGKGE